MTAARICAAEGCGRRLTGKGDLCRSHHGAALGAANRGRKHDPDVRARISEARKKAWADPEKNPLAALTETERADYDCVKRAMRYTRAEALRAIGRADLAEAAQ